MIYLFRRSQISRINLTGKVVLVTGASTGIGRAISESLAANGARVLACARKASDVEVLSALPNTTGLRLDVTCRAEIRAVADSLADRGTRLLAIINNAGTAAGRQFLQRLQAHLDEYGYQIFSLDPLLPSLADDPQPVLLAVRAYLDGQESPDERLRRMAGERAATRAAIDARLSGRQRRRLQRLLAEAREAARLREEALLEMGLAWRPLRRQLLEIGRRMAAAGALAEVGDVFWLNDSELRTAAADLDAGRTLTPLEPAIRARRADWHRWQALQPPPVLPAGSGRRWWWKYVFPVPEVEEQSTDHGLAGLGVSPGRVTAVARVIETPQEMARLKQGEVLVAHTTTPAWTPLFAYAAALVTDLGGVLAHGSIVAREYGIPAVMGTGSATRQIQDGQVVTVDGTAGRVYWTGSEA
ncbi:MAG: SDR family NAD(P)-dependent oxidoreductase [Anaerolineae bacterium]|nr:SDR family NAD(P)-dependent oxidoreductase [Anaerolineae bacterium]